MPEVKPNMLERAQLNLLGRFAGTKVVEPTMKRRLLSALGQAAVGVAGGLAFRQLVGRMSPNARKLMAYRAVKGPKPKFDPRMIKDSVRPKMNTPMTIASDAAMGTIYGLFEVDLKNALARGDKKEALKKLREADKSAFSAHRLEKTAFWGAVARDVGTGAKALGAGLAMGVGKRGTSLSKRMMGMAADDKVGLGAKAFGVAAKAGAGYAAYRGGKAIYNKVQRTSPNYKADYTTMLRNNILAGRIQSRELSHEDIASVQRRGMR